MEKMGNPGPIGLLGFGMTTVLLNIHNAGLTPLDDHILAMGIFVGGLAQVIAGILENKRGNTFASTAFTLYGFFWIALVWMVYHKFTAGTLATYLMIWG
ncbi:MAG TPA: acetate uptake transporter, partial [Smithellaceae bacterium]|nr:acetate uptake transporter [Smithellaceae bacterium]